MMYEGWCRMGASASETAQQGFGPTQLHSRIGEGNKPSASPLRLISFPANKRQRTPSTMQGSVKPLNNHDSIRR